MKVKGHHYHTIWINSDDPSVVKIIDQRELPFSFRILDLRTVDDAYRAIRNMAVRGAPLIGVTAAFGIYLALLNNSENITDGLINNITDKLRSARPTAVNLSISVDRMLKNIKTGNTDDEKIGIALQTALNLKDEELENSRKIGIYGLPLIEETARSRKDHQVNILTHCNAGWLACIDWGTATAPIYMAHNKGVKLHVWVDETRPRNQGARLTAWELGENNIPFYVALPTTSIDITLDNGSQIPVEKRDPGEVLTVSGWYKDHSTDVKIAPENTKTLNYGFDITPAHFISGLITEKGTCRAEKSDISKLKNQNNNNSYGKDRDHWRVGT